MQRKASGSDRRQENFPHETWIWTNVIIRFERFPKKGKKTFILRFCSIRNSDSLLGKIGRDKIIINYIRFNNWRCWWKITWIYEPIPRASSIKPSLTIPQGWFVGESNFTSLRLDDGPFLKVFENFHICDVFHYRSWEGGGRRCDRIQIPLDKSCVSPSNVSKHCRAQMSQAFYNKNISIRDTRQLFPERNEKYFIPGLDVDSFDNGELRAPFPAISKLFHEMFRDDSDNYTLRYISTRIKILTRKWGQFETMRPRGRTSSNNLKSSSENPWENASNRERNRFYEII